MVADASEYWNSSPRKNKPGMGETPRLCTGPTTDDGVHRRRTEEGHVVLSLAEEPVQLGPPAGGLSQLASVAEVETDPEGAGSVP
jgi:hypothetical protein